MSSNKVGRRKFFKTIAGGAAVTAVAGGAAYHTTRTIPARSPKRKVVVIGFDGVDPGLCQKYMDEGYLPNLSKLAQTGSFQKLGTSIPSQSPVAWSCFAVGGNPGQHGIYDFLTRLPQDPTYIPSPESFVGKVEPVFWHGIPIRMPKAINKQGGTPFWSYAADDGIRTALLMVPVTFAPPELPNGVALSGLGVPDLCGTQATYFFLTNDPKRVSHLSTEFGGQVIEPTQEEGRYQATLNGPLSPLWKQEKRDLEKKLHQLNSAPENSSDQASIDQLQLRLDELSANPHHLSIPIEITPGTAEKEAWVRIGEQTHHVILDEWSDWFRVKFQVTSLISIYGICRVQLQSLAPYVNLYVSPIDIDPTKPPIPISHHRSLSRELADKLGLYKTRGWAADTAAHKEGFIDEKAFMEDLFDIMDKRAAIMEEVLTSEDWGLFVTVFSATDRVSHMMWRFIDKDHPDYDAELDQVFGDSIRQIYQRMDKIVGRVRELINDQNTDLYVLSDHGFATFRQGVNINTWLSQYGPGGKQENPFMKLRITPDREYNLQDLFGGNTDFFKTVVTDPETGIERSEYYVDWSQTKAFSIGLGSIYINLRGRETHGCVPRSEYRAVCEEIIQALKSYRDPVTGEQVVREVYLASEIYKGPYVDPNSVAFPDLIVGFAKGYRAAWQSTLGGISPSVLEPNKSRWSGDHCGVDPSVMQGVLFSNRQITTVDPSIFDLAPTILAALEVPHGEMEGQPLEFANCPRSNQRASSDKPA